VVKLGPAVFKERTRDRETVEQRLVAKCFPVESDGCFGRFAPDHGDAALSGEFARTVENPRSNSANARLFLRYYPRVDGKEIEVDVAAPSPPAMGEAQDGRKSAPLGAGEQEKGEFVARAAGGRVANLGCAGDHAAATAVVAPALGGQLSEGESIAGWFKAAPCGRESPLTQENQIGLPPKREFDRARLLAFENAETHGPRLPETTQSVDIHIPQNFL
jgi:hypothetical protein